MSGNPNDTGSKLAQLHKLSCEGDEKGNTLIWFAQMEVFNEVFRKMWCVQQWPANRSTEFSLTPRKAFKGHLPSLDQQLVASRGHFSACLLPAHWQQQCVSPPIRIPILSCCVCFVSLPWKNTATGLQSSCMLAHPFNSHNTSLPSPNA